jgi:hypothetical protein
MHAARGPVQADAWVIVRHSCMLGRPYCTRLSVHLDASCDHRALIAGCARMRDGGGWDGCRACRLTDRALGARCLRRAPCISLVSDPRRASCLHVRPGVRDSCGTHLPSARARDGAAAAFTSPARPKRAEMQRESSPGPAPPTPSSSSAASRSPSPSSSPTAAALRPPWSTGCHQKRFRTSPVRSPLHFPATGHGAHA